MPDRRFGVDNSLSNEVLDDWRIERFGLRQVDMAHLKTCATADFFGVGNLDALGKEQRYPTRHYRE